MPSRFLRESDEVRFDAGRYNPRFIDALRILDESGMRLERLANIANSVFFPPRFKRMYVDKDNGVPFLQGSHVVHFQPADLKYLSKEHRLINDVIVKAGWVLVTRSGTVGRVTICPEEWDGWAASEHIIHIVPKEKECPAGYLCSFLASPLGQIQMIANIHGAVVDELTEDHLGNILVPLPDRREIKHIDSAMKKAVSMKSQAVASAEASIRRIMVEFEFEEYGTGNIDYPGE